MLRGSHHFPDGGRCQLGFDGLELFVEVFRLGELRRIHRLRQFGILMAPFEAGVAVCQRVPTGLEARLVRHGGDLSDHAEVWGSIDRILAPGGRRLGVEE
jgi:hypothetical protein